MFSKTPVRYNRADERTSHNHSVGINKRKNRQNDLILIG